VEQLKPILMDVDTGVDDALSIMLAVRSPKIDLLGITTVSGNVHVDKAVKNTLTVLEILGVDVDVARGMEQPMLRPLVVAEDVHGEGGLGYISPVETKKTIHPLHGVDFLIQKIMESQKKVTLVLLGPLTNIAFALKKAPFIKNNIEELIIMGGAGAAGGNITAAAEFNIYVDPEAAKIVFESGIRTKLVTWDACLQTYLTKEERNMLKESNDPAAQTAHSLIQFLTDNYKKEEVPLCDPTAMIAAIDETIIETKQFRVQVETEGTVTRGMTVIDVRPHPELHPIDEAPMLDVAVTVHRERLRDIMLQTLIK